MNLKQFLKFVLTKGNINDNEKLFCQLCPVFIIYAMIISFLVAQLQTQSCNKLYCLINYFGPLFYKFWGRPMLKFGRVSLSLQSHMEISHVLLLLTEVNPLTPKISLVILLTLCHIVLVMLVWRIWCWIN